MNHCYLNIKSLYPTSMTRSLTLAWAAEEYNWYHIENWVKMISLIQETSYIRSTTNTLSNTFFPTYSTWLVEIDMGPIKSCGSHVLFSGTHPQSGGNLPTWMSTNHREYVRKNVTESMLLAFLQLYIYMVVKL